MRGLFASTLDILGLFFVASLTVSVILQSSSVLQTASTSTMRATTTSTSTSTSISHDSPDGFQLMDEFFVPSVLTSSLWSLVSNTNTETTTDTIEDISTTRYIQNAVQQTEAMTPIVSLPLDGRYQFSLSRNATKFTTEDAATLPTLDSLVHNETGKLELVKGADVSWLLDFAIIGFGKCGTSTLMEWLGNHPQVACFQREISDLSRNKAEQFVTRLYEKLPEGPYKRGYKAPTDVTQKHVLKQLKDYFPKTGLIVGIRHPVWWFQSLYNFRTQNFGLGTQLPHPDQLIGKCTAERHNTCTFKGDFAFHLYKLGKTDFEHPTDLERQIQERWHNTTIQQQRHGEPVRTPNKILLFEMSQLSSTDQAKMDRLRSGVKDFVGLQEDMPPVPHKIPGKKVDNATQAIKNELKIRICDEEYAVTRKHLVELSVQTYHWLLESFLQSPDVVVSDRKDFDEAMKPWLSDPCDTLQTQ